ncbi:ABC transporter substrate-binding protein [Paenibacillus sp. JCM 10914]|nr:ABC transporter substrate-binding protein [Paenibacillus sp. JCM 10914]
MTKQSYIDKNKDTVQKFTNALYKAQQWVDTNSPEDIADAILPYFKDSDRDIVISAVKRYKEQGSYATDPIVDEDEWNNLLDVMDQAGELKEKIAPDKIVDNSFAEQAKASK